jgi:hypothetical protein
MRRARPVAAQVQCRVDLAGDPPVSTPSAWNSCLADWLHASRDVNHLQLGVGILAAAASAAQEPIPH